VNCINIPPFTSTIYILNAIAIFGFNCTSYYDTWRSITSTHVILYFYKCFAEVLITRCICHPQLDGVFTQVVTIEDALKSSVVSAEKLKLQIARTVVEATRVEVSRPDIDHTGLHDLDYQTVNTVWSRQFAVFHRYDDVIVRDVTTIVDYFVEYLVVARRYVSIYILVASCVLSHVVREDGDLNAS
jgi:hypothetical protein